MKRAASLPLRLITAAMLAVGIAALQVVLWGTYNRGASMIDASSVVAGFAYSPYQRHESPLRGVYPTPDEIRKDLKLLAESSARIRTYGALDTPGVVALANDYRLKVTEGIWLDRDHAKNDREMEAGLLDARKYRHVERVIVGNESILRGNVTVPEMIGYLKEANRQTRKPVSTAEPWHVWLKNPELANYVDFITIHLLPYHEGVPVEDAVKYALKRYDEVQKAFPHKKIVIGEIGWPSRGPIIDGAVPSVENEARFIREFLADNKTRHFDYYLMEAIDQPWKIDVEGWAGAYWGMYSADRVAKFPLEGKVIRDTHWQTKALLAAAIALLPMFLASLFLRGWSFGGRLWMSVLIQACATTFVLGMSVPVDYYLTQRDLFGLAVLTAATLLTAAVLLAHGFEFGEVLFKQKWERRFDALPPLPRDREPFVSIHLACYNEPPEMVIMTLESLAALNYENFEVLVLDNNTKDPALYEPLEKRCAELGPRFRFFHLEQWPGFKAGALNFGLRMTDPRAEVVGVVDADYVVDPDWIGTLVPHFNKEDVAVVQAPQAHRDWETQPFRRMCSWEFDGFFRIGMHHRNERNALIQHGTMTLVRRAALEGVGGWSEWCICEDTELGLRLIEKGYDTRYVDRVLGRGLTPSDFSAIKSQRFRWAFGAMQILKNHLPKLLTPGGNLTLAQRYHFLTGWFSWFGDSLHLVFVFASLAWTLGILFAPKTFGLPITITVIPIIAFMTFKAILGPVLYRRTMNCPWQDIAGASLLSVGMSHAISRGIFAGIVKRKGTFVVTPKGWKAKGKLAFFSPIREELGLLAALLLGAWAVYYIHPNTDIEVSMWLTVLLLETIPYFAALGCQIASYMPDRKDENAAPNTHLGATLAH